VTWCGTVFGRGWEGFNEFTEDAGREMQEEKVLRSLFCIIEKLHHVGCERLLKVGKGCCNTFAFIGVDLFRIRGSAFRVPFFEEMLRRTGRRISMGGTKSMT
jgi:hypothetical protein